MVCHREETLGVHGVVPFAPAAWSGSRLWGRSGQPNSRGWTCRDMALNER
ncbi:hypothetical protein FM114_13780 [Luteococcus japonicus LSP_Lj1]|uniref:Uncharacterized protein n=1 Tax=Luteococcus japonicus LSP_Lj1 TaxID=1255658 RepID=A0A1R4KFL5_9ACTN|nr:hypothetical protein FM114_13780 [Luteococcus japonicus LSP_Lj1]